MKKMMKQLFAIAILAAGTAGVAQAVPISGVATASDYAVFKTQGTASVAVTPVTGLMAGLFAPNTRLADVTAGTDTGIVAIRWTPDSGAVDATDSQNIVVNGKNTSAALKVSFDVSQGLTRSVSDKAWWRSASSAVSTSVMSDSVETNIPADRFPLSIDAAMWLE